ncbi:MULTISPECIES: hypothetical protein [Flavobacteriaceae]|uniref:hypothetical protein n=1 Tax=Flavobacteriaceae TaxID=49546 RepID=UPI00234A2CAC|nr:hypothetical protein [Muricauda sp. SP22]MDC6361853.1 hypothetical protein [Muricauda sp. SP22]
MKNPFRRKKKPQVEFPNDEVFWIPGNWNDRSEIVGSIAKNNMNEFVFAGYIMLNMSTQESFGIQILEKSDFDNLDFFGKFKDSDFFIRMDLTESEYNQQESIIKAGNAILKAGGLSIFAEKSGLIYSAESWNT